MLRTNRQTNRQTNKQTDSKILPTATVSLGVGRMFGAVCLFVCLFVRSITQKRMIPKCNSNLMYSRSDMVLGVERSKVKVTGSISAFFTIMTIALNAYM